MTATKPGTVRVRDRTEYQRAYRARRMEAALEQKGLREAPMSGPEAIAEVAWLLEGGVHPLLICQTLDKTPTAIDMLARRYNYPDVAKQFYQHQAEETGK